LRNIFSLNFDKIFTSSLIILHSNGINLYFEIFDLL
jgi:hypothetical protein